ncbi:Arylsulfatase [compost metagenome]
MPAIVQLPSALRRQGLERSVARVDDLAPTFLALAGVADPGTSWKGQAKHPITGHSMLPVLEGQKAPEPVLAGELFGSRYYREGHLKLLGLVPWVGPGEVPPPVRWQLFDLALDRGEQHDLALEQPQMLARMQQAWQQYARQVGVVAPPANHAP